MKQRPLSSGPGRLSEEGRAGTLVTRGRDKGRGSSTVAILRAFAGILAELKEARSSPVGLFSFSPGLRRVLAARLQTDPEAQGRACPQALTSANIDHKYNPNGRQLRTTARILAPSLTIESMSTNRSPRRAADFASAARPTDRPPAQPRARSERTNTAALHKMAAARPLPAQRHSNRADVYGSTRQRRRE